MGVRVNKIYMRIKESIRKTGTWPSPYLAWKLSACFPIGDPNQMNEHTEASVSPGNKEGTQELASTIPSHLHKTRNNFPLHEV
jgi:hypothetical protein